ncbi:hypothetical protein AOLI_G00233450 [Acnodon oligacanthus]
MELWRQCASWLIQCRVLPENHRVTWDSAQVCDLAHALRDGVLLCHLLNNLLPHAVNLREINLRPQMSQEHRDLHSNTAGKVLHSERSDSFLKAGVEPNQSVSRGEHQLGGSGALEQRATRALQVWGSPVATQQLSGGGQ